MRTISISLALVLAACGGAARPDVEERAGGEPVAHEHEAEGDEGHAAMHEKLTPEMNAFHDALAPLWHADTPDRQSSTCERAGELLQLGEKIQDAPNPGVDAETWGMAVRDLMLAIMKLMDECKTGGDFEANFGAVHDGFHRLMELLPAKGA